MQTDFSPIFQGIFRGRLRTKAQQRLGSIAGAAVAALLTASCLPANALVIFTIQPVGNSIVVKTGGSFSTEGLTFFNETIDVQFPSIAPKDSGLLTGVDNSDILLWDATFMGTPGTAFGTGDPKDGATTSSTSGSIFGFNVAEGLIYTNSPLAETGSPQKDCRDPNTICTISLTETTTVFDQESYATLGLTPGTYYWSWGALDEQKIQLDILPVPGPLPAAGAGVAFAWSRRLRRRARDAQQDQSASPGT